MSRDVGASPRRKGPPFAQILLVGGIALAALVQVLGSPPVGIADNSDFARIMGWFGLEHSAPARDRYWNYADFHYELQTGQSHDTRYYSSALPVAAGAVFAVRLAHRPIFDIRWLGMLYAVILVAAAWIAAPALSALSPPGRFLGSSLAVLLFADTAYVSYFNSFYTEPAVIVFFLLALAFAVRLGTRTTTDPAGITMGFAAAAVLFILARPQNASLTPIAIAVPFVAVRSARARRRIAPLAGVLLLAGILDVALAPRAVDDAGSYFGVFREMLPFSPDPAKDLRELGLEPALAAYSGTTPWSPDSLTLRPDAWRLFCSRVSLATVVRFYVRHPSRFGSSLGRVSAQLWRDRMLLGNFDRASGLPGATLSRRFSEWSTVKAGSLPRRRLGWCLLVAGAAGLIAVMMTRPESRSCGQACALLFALAAINVAIVAMLGWFSESPRLLVPFHLSIDAMVLIAVTAPFFRRPVEPGLPADGFPPVSAS